MAVPGLKAAQANQKWFPVDYRDEPRPGERAAERLA